MRFQSKTYAAAWHLFFFLFLNRWMTCILLQFMNVNMVYDCEWLNKDWHKHQIVFIINSKKSRIFVHRKKFTALKTDMNFPKNCPKNCPLFAWKLYTFLLGGNKINVYAMILMTNSRKVHDCNGLLKMHGCDGVLFLNGSYYRSTSTTKTVDSQTYQSEHLQLSKHLNWF